HILPLPGKVKALGAQNNGGTPPLVYHGGPVMLTSTVYTIFWIPPQLQDGTATSLPSAYQTVQNTMLKEYWGHSIATMNTQYYQGSGSSKKYIKSTGSFGGSYVDTSLYPGQDCLDSTTELTNPHNCITDTDIQNEIKKVMTMKGWTGGLNKMFFLFTSLNEGSCYSAGVCSYSYYCAYHSSFVNGSAQDVIYSNQPFGNTNVCQVPGAPSPNNNPAADAAVTAASHELSEAITDPLGTGWYDSSGYENGDECAYFYGFAGYNSGNANELWDGKPFYLQTEYSNVLQNWQLDPNFPGCFNAGPDL